MLAIQPPSWAAQGPCTGAGVVERRSCTGHHAGTKTVVGGRAKCRVMKGTTAARSCSAADARRDGGESPLRTGAARIAGATAAVRGWAGVVYFGNKPWGPGGTAARTAPVDRTRRCVSFSPPSPPVSGRSELLPTPVQRSYPGAAILSWCGYFIPVRELSSCPILDVCSANSPGAGDPPIACRRCERSIRPILDGRIDDYEWLDRYPDGFLSSLGLRRTVAEEAATARRILL